MILSSCLTGCQGAVPSPRTTNDALGPAVSVFISRPDGSWTRCARLVAAFQRLSRRGARLTDSRGERAGLARDLRVVLRPATTAVAGNDLCNGHVDLPSSWRGPASWGA